jgi:hypothetical protein
MQITPDTLPDYHFLLVAPNVEPEWFFEAARRYFERFDPTVISDGKLIGIVPQSYTIAVSILTRRDAFRSLAVEVAKARENAYVDALVYDTLEAAKLALDTRAERNQPFGVPLVPTPTPALRDPIVPTPGAIFTNPQAAGLPTSPPSGFITMTPSPTPQIGDPNATPPPQIDATPGAITGG